SKEAIVVGMGGERPLRALGFAIPPYPLNEGHAAFLPLSLLLQAGNGARLEAIREQCVFTTHTPVEAGHDRFDYGNVRRVLGDLISLDELKKLGGPDRLNMTHLALSLSGYVNRVARRTPRTAQSMFPGYQVRARPNGPP